MQGALFLKGVFGRGLVNGIIPGPGGVHPMQVTMHVLLEWEGWVGHGAMPAWPQAKRGMAAGNFLWKAQYHTTVSSSTPLKLRGLE